MNNTKEIQQMIDQKTMLFYDDLKEYQKKPQHGPQLDAFEKWICIKLAQIDVSIDTLIDGFQGLSYDQSPD